MLRYSLVRLVQLVVLLFVASIVAFLVIRNSPGDPARSRLGLEATPQQIAVERHRLGLDQSPFKQYVVWMSDAVHLDFGNSFSNGLPVTQVLSDALYYTTRLTVLATLIALVLGAVLGLVAALNRGRRIDVVISALASGGFSVPSFALGTLLILILSVKLGWLPSAGAGDVGQSPRQALSYLILPAITLAIPFAVVLIRFIRVAVGEAMAQDYIVTARAKGLTRSTVLLQHGVRNAMIPTVTVAGIQVGQLLAGAVVTETVFSYPGLGRLTIQSIQGLDYPVVQAALLLEAAIFLTVTFIVDLAYGLIDPRVRLGGQK